MLDRTEKVLELLEMRITGRVIQSPYMDSSSLQAHC